MPLLSVLPVIAKACCRCYAGIDRRSDKNPGAGHAGPRVLLHFP